MNRAIKLPQYSDMKPFSPPDGVQMVRIDKNTWLPADASCPDDYSLAFLDGTVPANACSHVTGESPLTAIKDFFGIGGDKSQPEHRTAVLNRPRHNRAEEEKHPGEDFWRRRRQQAISARPTSTRPASTRITAAVGLLTNL